MKLIPLTQGQVAIVDDEDWPELSKHKWCAYYHKVSKNWCACRGVRVGRRVFPVKMSRFIMGDPEGKEVDHINHDGLDNRRENLRVCTHQENGRNRRHRPDARSQYKGLEWNKKANKWRAIITVDCRVRYIGLFTDERQAALAYDRAAREHFGEFACLNFPEAS